MPRFCILLAALLVLCANACAQEKGIPVPDQGAATPLKLNLREAVELAIRNNLDLRQAMLDERIRQEQVREALGTFDPTIFTDIGGGRREVLLAANFPADPSDPLSPTVTRLISSRQDEMNLAFGIRGILDTGLDYRLATDTSYRFRQAGDAFNPIYSASTTLTFTQPLLRAAWQAFHQAPAQLARLDALSAHEAWRGLVRDKIKEVQQAYFDLVFTTLDLEVKKESLAVAVDQIERTETLVRTGTLARVEITTAKAAKAGRDADLVTAEAAAITAEDLLRRLILSFEMERDWETRLAPTETVAVRFVSLLPLKKILQTSERTEPSVLEARLAVASAEVELTQRKNSSRPRLDLTGTVGVVGLADDLFEGHHRAYKTEGAFSWSAGLAFEYPLGNRAADSRRIQAELSLKRSRISLQNVRTELVFQVRKALRDIDVASRSIEARKEATRLASEQLVNEKLKRDLRTSTNFEVFGVEQELSRRKTEEIRSILDYRLALLELSRVSGLPVEALVVPPAEKTEEKPR